MELVAAVAGAGAVAEGASVFLRDGLRVADESFQVDGAFVEDALLVGGFGEEGVHVVDEFFEGVFDGGHGAPPGRRVWVDVNTGWGEGEGGYAVVKMTVVSRLACLFSAH